MSSPADSGITVAGGNGFGSAPNQLFNPQYVFVDANGNLYVSEVVNERVQKFPPGSTSSTNGTTVAGGNGPGSAANQLWQPIGIFVDAKGNLYIADQFNQRIVEWVPGAANGVTVAGGNGTGALANQFNDPYGIYVDGSGNIYVADWLNSRVQKWAPGALSGITVAGGNGAGPAANQLNGPTDVFVDSQGNIYVVDRTNERIQMWAPGANFGITVAGGNGIGNAANQLDAPFSIYINASGNLYVSDAANNRIQEFPSGSNNSTSGVTVAGGNGAGNASNQLNVPGGIWFDGSGDLFVVDFENQRVQEFKTPFVDSILIPASSGIYYAYVKNKNGCIDTLGPITINPTDTSLVSVNASQDTICQGGSIIFSATVKNGGSSPFYQWQINGINTGTNSIFYTNSNLSNGDGVRCILTNSLNCALHQADSSETIKITVKPVLTPSILIHTSDSVICKGTLGNFDALFSNGGINPSFEWYVNGGLSGKNSSSFSNNTFSNGDSVQCIMFPDTSEACYNPYPDSSNYIVIQVDSVLNPSVSVAASKDSVCPGDSIEFIATIANGGPNTVFQWQLNGANIGTDTLVFSDNHLNEGDVLNCMITTSGGSCVTGGNYFSNQDTVHFLKTPDVAFLSSDTTILPGQTVILPVSIIGDVQSFNWSPADKLSTPNSPNPLTIPLNSTTIFLFTALSNEGCELKKKYTVFVYRKLNMPSAFTPNGDGKNDVYRIPSNANIQLVEFSIYNRWGEKIFSTNDKSKGWDGSFRGSMQSSGSFVYVVTGTDLDGPVFEKGTFVLIR
ncbi:MAG TPA: T9SS type B sorting domain-containing protein [Puia sp.]|nr:T9SS type B sorting domain-containing protein [Puia sp.]